MLKGRENELGDPQPSPSIQRPLSRASLLHHPGAKSLCICTGGTKWLQSGGGLEKNMSLSVAMIWFSGSLWLEWGLRGTQEEVNNLAGWPWLWIRVLLTGSEPSPTRAHFVSGNDTDANLQERQRETRWHRLGCYCKWLSPFAVGPSDESLRWELWLFCQNYLTSISLFQNRPRCTFSKPFRFTYEYVCACHGCVCHVCVRTYGSQKNASDSLELEIYTVAG